MNRDNSPFRKGRADGLSQYSPPDALWDSIADELELREALTKLPVHEPPSGAWGAVEAAFGGKNRNRRIPVPAAVLRWAAGLALLIAGAVIYRALSGNEEGRTDYRVEWSTAGEESFERGESGSVRSIIDQLCARAVPVCESSDFKAMEEELYKLERARDEVEARMSPYADNDELERMLMQIELQHAEIVKQMTNTLL